MSETDILRKMAQNITDAIENRIKEEYAENFTRLSTEICMGADGTWTQYIDQVAEQVALDIIGETANILSEEAGFIDHGKKYTLIIDPIDGTRNAVNGIPFYCTSIAIGEKCLTDVVYGLVRNITTGDTFYAEKSVGAYLNGNRIQVAPHVREPIYLLALGHSSSQKTYQLVTKHNIRALGAAALEMSLVGAGAADLYFQGNEYLRVTDIAASTLIVREAGGKVYDARGNVLDMDLTLSKRSSVLAVASPDIMEDLL
jgi:fructose-1,6-bisphosphatase/inositol monophosphatase family enzyme